MSGLHPGPSPVAAVGDDEIAAGRILRLSFAVVAFGLAANLLFNLLMSARGFGYPYDNFMADPVDRFADFLKVALGYAGPAVHSLDPGWGLDRNMALFHRQVASYAGTPINHYHMLPTSTLIAIGLRQMIAAVDPGWALVITFGTMLAVLAGVAAGTAPLSRDRGWMAATALIAYPTVFAVDRGHLYSLICGTALIAGAWRSLKLGRGDWTSVLLFALALNIRPNAALIPLALFLFRKGWTVADGLKLAVATIAIFAGGMFLAHLLYPAYSLAAFRGGLDDYSKLYLIREFGQAFNSSLFGALRALFGFSAWTFLLPIGIAVGLFVAGCATAWRRPVPDAAMMFVVLSAYALGSQVFGDYHLVPFLLPIALVARGAGGDRVLGWTIFAASCAVLIPKNYIFHLRPDGPDWSWQVVINPVTLLVASVIVLVRLRTGREYRLDKS